MVNTINNQAKPLSADEASNKTNEINVNRTKCNLKTFKYRCELCNELFKKRDSLDRHLFQHTGVKSFICEIKGCGKKYSNKSHLSRHKKTSHGDSICELPRVHSTSFSCEDCDLKFRQKLQLKKHRIIEHTGQYPLSCSQCQKGFLNTKSLNRHKKIHDFVQCSECDEKLPNWSRLVIHRRRYHQPAPIFICDLCNKKFTRRPNLREHMKLHSMSSEVYQCHYENCAKFYTAKRNLFSHIRSKHEGKRFICDYCNQQKTTKQKLGQHILSHIDPTKNKPKILPFLRKLFPPELQKEVN